MNKHIGMLLGIALLLAMQGVAWAEHERDGGHENMMEQADTNHDGKVSHDEFKAAHEKRMEEMFKKLDANGDGFIDKDEMRKGREMMREKMKEHMQKRKEIHDQMQEQKTK
ncbi:MAG TPA: EF-hand domain-containing protein [Novimethylophilus sp.]|jgi:Ca2+-binding EF-hand superfamily protein|uniref:EF-hand domain-containing protein n=1 Tax=Novimethylophilus sp. TaxID=2137426 RepID=UPI002F422C93